MLDLGEVLLPIPVVKPSRQVGLPLPDSYLGLDLLHLLMSLELMFLVLKLLSEKGHFICF